MWRPCVVWIALALACWPGAGLSARPPGDPPSGGAGDSPRDRFNAAVDLAAETRYEEAVKVWLDILDKLDSEYQPKACKALGRAFQKMNRLPEAWHFLTAYRQISGPVDAKAGEWLVQVEEALRLEYGRVKLTCTPADAVLRFKAPQPSAPEVAVVCPAAWWFKPGGQNDVHAEQAGFAPRDLKIPVARRGFDGTRDVVLTPLSAEKKPKGKNGETITKEAEPERVSRTLEWTLIGSGIALAAAGGVFHGLGYSKNEDLHAQYLESSQYPYGPEAKDLYQDAYDDQVHPKMLTAYALYGVGGAAVISGIVTWILRDEETAGRGDGPAPVAIAPLGPSGGTGAVLNLTW